MKVTLFMAISLNGIIATPDNQEEFLSHANWDEFIKVVQKRGCLIWGRKTYELVRLWPKSYLEPFKNIVKVVISRDKNLKLDSGFVLADSPQTALKLLKDKSFKEVILTGGSTNNSAFAKLGLIDEVILDIEGVIVGKGIPLFNPEEFELKLQLKSVKKVTENILQVCYKVLR
ncbi:hypothetical protein COW80_00940 [Candidatus Beckwithbacteria bacterium CG22_combo_CG10-13_8_21_14_all_01_47_9]|uniref:Bacterial bifunctional deaminase-reductase C-terminal domain-containing protein n=2 Tax=Candidatus Beckwithiibacteriota TaxID=1752726 RepID=A0A2H0E3D6_9BACT|nr:MAG: hypothetical protein AUJ59_00625 [Candidatus Beckwithbacteria bacterium CG1_02_47_37]PIP88330.1 MAG: hypothetical protein COW80_00940 [Candidatus Beckwithbacteria bacterium CG22_combo_CG10-13_8_21_14_all_01_47_9]